jgi:hypothetical protein
MKMKTLGVVEYYRLFVIQLAVELESVPVTVVTKTQAPQGKTLEIHRVPDS